MSYQDLVISHTAKAFSGGAKQIPFSIAGFDTILGVRQGTYTLLGGNTGSGKTTFVDQEYVLHAYDWVKKNPGFRLKILYYSMERRKQHKLQKWTSWKIWQDHKLVITPDQLSGYQALSANMTPDYILQLLHKYEQYFDEMMDHVTIQDGPQTAASIYYAGRAYAYEHGSYYWTLKVPGEDGVYLMRNADEKIATFSESRAFIDSVGRKKMYVDIKTGSKDRKIIAFENQYIPNHPEEFVLIPVDHMGKIKPEKGQDKWAAIGDMSNKLGSLRDRFLQSPVAINQFNRSIGDVQRAKLYGDDLLPQLEDFEGQAVTQHDSDLILGIFDPARYKRKSCLDYDIDAMRTPGGNNRFRSISILKNTTGVDQVHLGLRFTGEVGLFEGLPQSMGTEIEDIYRQISNGN